MDAVFLGQYNIKSTLGQTDDTAVYFAEHRNTETFCAIKMIRKYQEGCNSCFFNKEIRIMKQAQHPFICRFYEAFETESALYIVMEYVNSGCLLDEIYKYGKISERDASIIFAELMLALKYLHKTCHAAHRDIKPENILLDENHNIRLIDFGLSSIHDKNSLMKTQCGSIYYAAPELILGVEYTNKVDVWSSGVLLYLMLTGGFPFKETNASVLAQKIVSQDVEFPSNISLQAKDLIMRMLTRQPRDRISVDEILEHPWVRPMKADIDSMIQGICISDSLIANEEKKYKMVMPQNKDMIRNVIIGKIYSQGIKSAFYSSQTKPHVSKSLPELKLERPGSNLCPRVRQRPKKPKIMSPSVAKSRKSVNL